jgi:SRSO17 transposase
MEAERWEADAGESLVLEEGAALWERLYERIAAHFGRVEVRARLKRYLAGALARVERKNGWQLAEAIGEAGPQGIQRLLNAAVWDAEAVRDELRAYVVEHLGDSESGVLVVAESGFPKKGNASCGVASQYCGATGSTTNCQVGVFLGYASRHGMAFLDRALHVPRIWTDDRTRQDGARIPEDVRFATKPALAKQMLARAFAAKVPARWVVADRSCGRAHHLRRWLEEEKQGHVVGILPSQVVNYQGQRQRAQAVGTPLSSDAWVRRSAGEGSQGPRVRDWAVVALTEECPTDWRRRLLVRRAPDDPTDCAYVRASGPAETTAVEPVRVAGTRWAIEGGLARAKGEASLDPDEVRRREAWHRFMTPGLLAHASLAIVSSRARQTSRDARQDDAQKGEVSAARRLSR